MAERYLLEYILVKHYAIFGFVLAQTVRIYAAHQAHELITHPASVFILW